MWSFGPQTHYPPKRRWRVLRAAITALLAGGVVVALSGAQAPPRQTQPGLAAAPSRDANPRALLNTYCITCHNQKLRTAGLALDSLDAATPSANAELWERVIAKLRSGSMPPPGMPRPDAAAYRAVAGLLENEIDRAWAGSPIPGSIGAVHRLNRTEYNNAIRDLFALDIDVKPLLPGDETADGSFDNFAAVL